MHSRQGSGFSQGEVDDDGFIVHTAKEFMRTASASIRPSQCRSSGFRHESVRRSVLSQTSQAAAQRGLILPAGGIGASVFNLCSATLGAGVLALPKCGAYSGWLLTSVYVTCSGFASAYAIVVLVMVSSRTGFMSYEEMALKILGSRKWVWITVVLIALLCFGTAVGYIIAIGDILDPFRKINGAPEWLQTEKGRLLSQVAWWLCFFLPASLPKHVNALRLGSLCGVFSIAYLLVMMSVHLGMNDNKPTTEMVKGGVESLFSLPVIMFGYGCQVNTFEIYREMYRPSTKRMTITATIALALCSSFYIGAGIIGYLDFGSSVKDNVLNSFEPTHSPMAAIAFVGISITVSMAFPLCVFPTRDALEFLIWPPTDNQLQEDVAEGQAGAPESPHRGTRQSALANRSGREEEGADTSPQKVNFMDKPQVIRDWSDDTMKQGGSTVQNRAESAPLRADSQANSSDGAIVMDQSGAAKPQEDTEKTSDLLLSKDKFDSPAYGSVSSIHRKDSQSLDDESPFANYHDDEDDEEHEGMSDCQRRILVTVLCVLILIAGLFIPNITTAFGVIGGLCIGPIGYSIPAAFAIKSGKWSVESVGRVHVIGVYALFVYGIICALLGTGVSVYSIIVQSE